MRGIKTLVPILCLAVIFSSLPAFALELEVDCYSNNQVNTNTSDFTFTVNIGEASLEEMVTVTYDGMAYLSYNEETGRLVIRDSTFLVPDIILSMNFQMGFFFYIDSALTEVEILFNQASSPIVAPDGSFTVTLESELNALVTLQFGMFILGVPTPPITIYDEFATTIPSGELELIDSLTDRGDRDCYVYNLFDNII